MARRLVIRHEWANGSRVRADVEDAAAQLAQLAERDGAVLLPAVLEASRESRAPLHHDFEWHDPTAAHLYRLGQAGHVVRSLRRVTVDLETEEVQPPERVYIPMTRAEPAGDTPPASATYVPVRLVQDAEEQAARLRESAIARIERLAAELRALTACADIAGDLAEVIKRYR